MEKIQIQGRIQYIPGSWGFDTPTRNASVEIIDIDLGGSDDILWCGTTDHDGKFSGTTKEWQDTKAITVWVQESLFPFRGHWEKKRVPDPTDLLLLKLRVKQAGRIHEVFPFLNLAPIPVIVPWGPPTVLTKDSRALIILNNLVDIGIPDFRDLYRFLEASGDNVARTILGPFYKSITSLNGSEATLDAFCNALRTVAQLQGVKAVDAIINMHGSTNRIFFYDGGGHGIEVSEVQTQLVALGIQNKLRMVYNTCCYGGSHATELCAGGFNAAIGARKVNANSPSEYPVLLSLWAAGGNLKNALAAAQTPALREPMDAIARHMLPHHEVDSYKTITGNKNLTIESSGR